MSHLARRLFRSHPELSLFAVAYLAYVGARWAFASDLTTARAHARIVLDIESWSGTGIERSVQQAFSSTFWVDALADVYLAAQLLVLPVTLIALHRFARPVYRTLRNTVIATWAISIPIFALFPVAPPRLAGIGLADTVSANAGASLNGSSTLFYNPYAAVPSLHVGFAFAVSIAVATAVRNPALKLVASLWGPLVTLAVVATGNHYTFDVAAGLIVTAVGCVAGHAIEARLVSRSITLPRILRLPKRRLVFGHSPSA